MLCGDGLSPYAWEAHLSQGLTHRVRVNERKRPRSETYCDDIATHTHTFVVDLDFADSRMASNHAISITPFNPLASVLCNGQKSRGDGAIADLFASLDALTSDAACNCGKHGMPNGWLSAMNTCLMIASTVAASI